MNVWEDITDLAQKDVLFNKSITTFENIPHQRREVVVTSDTTGQMEISCIRSIAERELGRHFTSEEFLYELLRQGKLPQGYLEEHIRDYIACKKDPTIEGCKEF